MSITLQLTPDEERALRLAAATEGKDVSTYIRHRIFSVAPNVSSHDLAFSDLSFLRQTAASAVQEAQSHLMKQGIGYVYRRTDGIIVRHRPDGTEVPLLVAEE